MHRATYGNLLQVFVDAGHGRCAEALCEVLRKKCEIIYQAVWLLIDPDHLFILLQSIRYQRYHLAPCHVNPNLLRHETRQAAT